MPARRLSPEQVRQLGDVRRDAPCLVAGDLRPCQRLPAHCEKMLAYKAEQHLGTGETMRRREFIALMGASVTWPFAALAQQAGRTYRLGCLLPLTRDAPINAAFFEELRRRGFIEGQNLTVEWRTYGGHGERLVPEAHDGGAGRTPLSVELDLIPQYAAELVKARVDVIVTAGDHALRALQQATKTIPIVAEAGDMLGSGFVNSMARPDGNTTGVNIVPFESDGKRQDILIEAVPGLRLMAVLVDVNDRSAAPLDALQEAARAHGIEFSIHRVARGEEIAAAMDSAQASGAKALFMLSSILFYAHRHLIMNRAAAAHLPTIWPIPELAEQGGFAAYGPRSDQPFLEVTLEQVIKLFRGTKVADIPVEQPTKFALVINLKTAKAMGVTVPESLLARADKVIE
jgi:putative ABC transport system substrate-binding protein